MKLFTFSLFVIAVIFSFGCNAENPICSTNFCAIGEVFPRSELEDGQAFSEVDIDDSVIFATLVGTTPVETTPVETTPVETPVADVETPVADSVTLADIVNDVAINGVNSVYKGQTVTITAAVRYIFAATEDRNAGVTLATFNNNISFFVNDDDEVDDLAHLGTGTTYTFRILIENIAPSRANPERTNIWSNALNQPPKANIDIENVAMAEIVSDVAAGRKTYLGKTIRLNATVSFDLFKEGGFISLSTGNRNVSFTISDIGNPEKLNAYHANINYIFILFIEDIEDEETPGEYSISGVIADD